MLMIVVSGIVLYGYTSVMTFVCFQDLLLLVLLVAFDLVALTFVNPKFKQRTWLKTDLHMCLCFCV